MSLLLSGQGRDGVAAEVATISEQNFFACYQCGRCTAACPFVAAMDVPPHQMIRLFQLGQADKAMESASPWVCVGCLTCVALCPKGVDPARIMEALRAIHLRRLETPFRYAAQDAERLSTLPQSAVVAAMRKVVQ